MALKDRGEEWKEYDDAVRWMMIAFFICLGLTVVMFIFALPLSYLVGHGVSKGSTEVVNKFLYLNTVFDYSGGVDFCRYDQSVSFSNQYSRFGTRGHFARY